MEGDRLRIVRSPPLDAVGQMALDEALLEGPFPAALRFFAWSRPGLTFGYFQAWALAAQTAVREGLGAPIRRLTGGGIVLHRGDVTFSVVFPWEDSLAPQTFYKRLHRALHLRLGAARLATRLVDPGAVRSGPRLACFAEPSACDLVLDTPGPSASFEKVLGGALRKRRGRGLYQGSLQPPGTWDERAARAAVLGGVSDLLSQGPQAWEETDVPPAVQTRAAQLAASRYGTREWNEKR